VRGIAAFKPKFEELKLGEALDEPTEKLLTACSYAYFFDGGIAPNASKYGDCASIKVRAAAFGELTGEISMGQFYYRDAAKTKQLLAAVPNAYVHVSKIPPAQLEALKTLCSSKGLPRLSAKGLGLVNDETFKAARQLNAQRNQYVSKELLKLAEAA
jgi:hypothetical protein